MQSTYRNTITIPHTHLSHRAGPRRSFQFQFRVLGLFIFFITILLAYQFTWNKVTRVVVEIYPYPSRTSYFKSSLRRLSQQMQHFCRSCTRQNHASQDDVINTDTTLLSFPTCMRLSQQIQCSLQHIWYGILCPCVADWRHLYSCLKGKWPVETYVRPCPHI